MVPIILLNFINADRDAGPAVLNWRKQQQQKLQPLYCKRSLSNLPYNEYVYSNLLKTSFKLNP